MIRSAAERPLRVAQIIQNLNYGGMERVLHDLSRGLPSRGFEVHVVVLEYFGRFAEGLQDSVTFHQVAPMTRASFLRPGSLISVLQGIKPDIVHSHAGVWYKAALAARYARVPGVVQTDHGRPDPVPFVDRMVDNRASRWTDAVIAVSDALAAVIKREVVQYPERVRVIVNGVDTERLKPATDRTALRNELQIPEGALVIGSIGRLEPIKHYQLAVRALARLGPPSQGQAAPWLVLVGDGSERPVLERMAAELGVAERVKFLGWRADPERLYGAFDLFTLTSRSEGTSISLLEAMSSALCPVVTDVGGNRAVLGPGLESLMVPDDDEVALTAAWKEKLESAQLRNEMGRHARQRVERSFSLTRNIDQHAALYRELVASPRNRSNAPARRLA